MESDPSSSDDTHASPGGWRSTALRPLTAPVLLLAVALGLFLAGGATATGLGIASHRQVDRCASFAEGGRDGFDLRGADLSGAMLAGVELCGANLRGAVLKNACLRGARLDGADLTGAVLAGADMTGAQTSGAVGLPEDVPESRAACN